MTLALQFRYYARQDLEKNYRWYQRYGQSLANRFLMETQKHLDQLCRNPERFEILLRLPFRRSLMKKFPYVILFMETEESIIVLGIVHTKRHPRIFQRRMRDQDSQ